MSVVLVVVGEGEVGEMVEELSVAGSAGWGCVLFLVVSGSAEVILTTEVLSVAAGRQRASYHQHCSSTGKYYSTIQKY